VAKKISPKAYTTYGMLSKYPDWEKDFKKGILGSIDVETGGTFDFQTKQKGGTGYGLYQFERGYTDPKTGVYHNGQLDDYEIFLKDNNLKDSGEAQTEFVHKSMTMKSSKAPHDLGWKKRGNLQGMFNSKDTDAVSDTLMDNYFMSGTPHLNKRKKSSKGFPLIP